jgi:redox-sensing transcriptional repressor
MARTKRAEKQAPLDVGRETVERLSRYRSVLLKLQGMGFSKVFSGNLGDALGLSGSQVRKDFAAFGMRGVKRGGYDITGLLARMAALLGTSEQCRAVVIGCGKIGQALVRSFGGRRSGVSIVAGFDSEPKVVSPVPDVPVLDIGELSAFVRKHGIEVAILCTPEQSVPHLLEQLRSTGVVRGILNFTPTPLRSDEACCVQNIDIRMELEKLFCLVYYAKRRGGEGKRT